MTQSTAPAQAHLIISDGVNTFTSLLLPWQAPCQNRYHLSLCSWHRGGIKAKSCHELRNTPWLMRLQCSCVPTQPNPDPVCASGGRGAMPLEAAAAQAAHLQQGLVLLSGQLEGRQPLTSLGLDWAYGTSLHAPK